MATLADLESQYFRANVLLHPNESLSDLKIAYYTAKLAV